MPAVLLVEIHCPKDGDSFDLSLPNSLVLLEPRRLYWVVRGWRMTPKEGAAVRASCTVMLSQTPWTLTSFEQVLHIFSSR
jgi:hypothetical protein